MYYVFLVGERRMILILHTMWIIYLLGYCPLGNATQLHFLHGGVFITGHDSGECVLYC